MAELNAGAALSVAAPHKLIADDEYEGYDLPGGSIIVGNTW